MVRIEPYLFKMAETAEEFEQIHRLNYQTFVQEIPQHADSGTGALVDKFHLKNSYIIGLRDGVLIGMLSFHDQPPFSVAARMADPAVLTKEGRKPVEIRLLAIQPGERHSLVMTALIGVLHEWVLKAGYTHLVISGVVEQQKLYAHMGFEPIGDAVGVGRARYIPMWATLESIEACMGRTKRLWTQRLERQALRS